MTTTFDIVEYPKAVNYDFDMPWPEKEDVILAVMCLNRDLKRKILLVILQKLREGFCLYCTDVVPLLACEAHPFLFNPVHKAVLFAVEAFGNGESHYCVSIAKNLSNRFFPLPII